MKEANMAFMKHLRGGLAPTCVSNFNFNSICTHGNHLARPKENSLWFAKFHNSGSSVSAKFCLLFLIYFQ